MENLAIYSAQIEPKLKAEAEFVFRKLGISTIEAITLFYQQVVLTKGLPFRIRVPNETTVRTFQNTDANKEVVHCQDADELFEELGIQAVLMS